MRSGTKATMKTASLTNIFRTRTDREMSPATISTSKFRAQNSTMRETIHGMGLSVGVSGNVQLFAARNPFKGTYTITSEYLNSIDGGVERHFQQAKETVMSGVSRDEAVGFMKEFQDTMTALHEKYSKDVPGAERHMEFIFRDDGPDHINLLADKLNECGMGPDVRASGADKTMAARLHGMKQKNTSGR